MGGVDTTRGAQALAQGLRYNRSLAKLQLNKIGPEGTDAMRSANFFTKTIDDVIKLDPQSLWHSYSEENNGILYNWSVSSSTRDLRKRLPLHRSADIGLRWMDGMREILKANYLALREVDAVTGLYPFMLAAVGETSDMTSVFNLLSSNPQLIYECQIL